MLPEIILNEEEKLDYTQLVFLGGFAGIAGFIFAHFLFPSQRAILTPVFSSIPLIYPLMTYYLRKEERPRFVQETSIYVSLFIGMTAAFFSITFLIPGAFEKQLEIIGVTGYAATQAGFFSVLFNNLLVFKGILLASFLLGSAGAFVLVWNASVLGSFFSYLIRDISSIEAFVSTASPIAYIPHASLEITGFIIAGIVGTTASASIYRNHMGLEHWKRLLELYVIGILAIISGAFIETF